ncbi:hypothetical protein C7B65_10690 [Phormidesmis priestleyi ULC007]|uniref:Transferase hexapeptide repeat containing protein n=1 Tax=Phormidesmis priestleyi ULC007 TaxID=1920490 RepID=A0A2T1DGZ1_9CYAN|nr:hypothetical protein [Phormidesmis priestleyi]PSB19748.1 hypothetical protein C7B65_10690 [Phormidesmis priestleyi ULC007]PZO53632.1 MAG: hypothetical protein DCF14_04395 [Phormidesmis priestleyi]
MTSQQLEERSQQLEARVIALEAEIVQIKQLLSHEKQTESPWWEKVVGSFVDRPDFDEMKRLERILNKSLKPCR